MSLYLDIFDCSVFYCFGVPPNLLLLFLIQVKELIQFPECLRSTSIHRRGFSLGLYIMVATLIAEPEFHSIKTGSNAATQSAICPMAALIHLGLCW